MVNNKYKRSYKLMKENNYYNYLKIMSMIC